MLVVVKIGTSSLTDDGGRVESAEIRRICRRLSELRADGQQAVLVTSAAIGVGRFIMGFESRPDDPVTLQALSAVGQGHLMSMYAEALESFGITAAQILLTPLDFFERNRYLRVRHTIQRLLEMDVLPIINENDAVADDAIRFGDNDRIAALVAQLISADLLVLLTDIEGLMTEDPRLSPEASLIAEIEQINRELEAIAGGIGNQDARGGMASKLSAAKIAAWGGVATVIAANDRRGVLRDAVAGKPVGTLAKPRKRRLSARKLWIGFAMRTSGKLFVDEGARRAVVEHGRSLLAVGVKAIEGDFLAGDAVEVAGADGEAFAKGLVSQPKNRLESVIGKRSVELGGGSQGELIHRDNMVVLL